ncbi:MAG TPA: FtsX-like permease family protein, partial [Chryseosolibacter sp.]|nr:FtsX-like permease family protein [Chryseosolibacter sp.]
RHVSDAKLKFRVYNVRSGNDGVTSTIPIVPYPFAAYVKKDFPEVKTALRIMDTYGEVLFESGEKRLNETGGIYTEPAFFSMLSVQVLAGDVNALANPQTVALSRAMAEKYFGSADAVGKSVRISKEDYQVTAVYENIPRQSHLRPPFVLSLQSLARNWSPTRKENWVWQQFFTYLEFHNPVDAKSFEAKMLDFVKRYAYPKIEPEGFIYVPHLQAVQDIHLHSQNFEWEIADRGSAETVYILGITAVLILVIACLNFINLSTARSLKRMKEVGVRKVVGAYRRQLIFQFITESVIFTLLGLTLAIAIVELALPYMDSFAGKPINDPMTFAVFISLIAFAVVLGILAGSYPAFHVSNLRPSLIFHQKERGGAAELFRKSLVVLQFSFSFFLIIGAMIVVGQHDMLLNTDMGFNKEQLITIPLHRAHLAHAESTKQQFLNVPGVTHATLGFGLPGDLVAGDGVIDPVTKNTLPTNLFIVDQDYIPTFQMSMVAGRNFRGPSDTTGGFVINETAVKNFALKDPQSALGKMLEWHKWGGGVMTGPVIGVVGDFHFRTMKEKVEPAVMVMYPKVFGMLTVRIAGGEFSASLPKLRSVYESISPDWPFDFKTIDERFAEMYKNEAKLSTLLTYFAGFAIFIACLGLFGLVEYSVHQRAREISIRKVFGAGVVSVLLLLTQRYFMLILWAFILVIPLSYYTATQWLENFAYHIEVTPVVFMKAALVIVIVTVATVTWQSVKAALTNPARILKNE